MQKTGGTQRLPGPFAPIGWAGRGAWHEHAQRTAVATGLYRNNYADVKLFMEDYHRGHYKIYNLCSERAYAADRFMNRVALYPFDDHHAPTMDLIDDFCEDAAKWLGRHPKNAVAIHCKAGKGRTGVMISCLLMRLKLQATAVEALKHFGDLRTQDGQGVTIPSQTRYVHHYERFLGNDTLRLKCRRLLQVIARPSDHIPDSAYLVVLQDGVLLCSTKGESLDLELMKASVPSRSPTLPRTRQRPRPPQCWSALCGGAAAAVCFGRVGAAAHLVLCVRAFAFARHPRAYERLLVRYPLHIFL